MNKEKTLICLIVPVYNVHCYLRQCLDSIVSQNYENIEVLIVDDGSTDGSGTICDEYASIYEYITVFHTPNHGLSVARNYGLDHVSDGARYISFLDSDDWLEEDALSIMYSAACKYNADIVSCQYIHEYLNATTAISCKKVDERVFDGSDCLYAHIVKGVAGNAAWNKLYKVSLFSGIRYPEGRWFEDISTTYKLFARAESLVDIPNVLVHYRVRKSSISNNHSIKNLIDYWIACYKRYQYLNKYEFDDSFHESLVGSCLMAISRMWRWYAGCTPAERRLGSDTIEQMIAFVNEHSEEVLKSNAYTFHQKAVCIFARKKSSIIMWILHKAILVYKVIRNKKAYK